MGLPAVKPSATRESSESEQLERAIAEAGPMPTDEPAAVPAAERNPQAVEAERPSLPEIDRRTALAEGLGFDDAVAIARKIRTAVESINTQVIGREDLTHQAILALLTREHQLVYSRKGMAKSLFARRIFDVFEDAATFKIQMTKGTLEEAVVGALDIEELKRGRTIHNTEGSLVRAQFAFIDEAFDANDVTLRSMLGILNEREFVKGQQQEKAPLHTAIATSNYVRRNDITEALVDRFVFTAVLPESANYMNRLRIDHAYEDDMAQGGGSRQGPRIPFHELAVVADVVEGRNEHLHIKAPDHVLFLKNVIVEEYTKLTRAALKGTPEADFMISPRTSAKTRDLLNAAALLAGRDELAVEDLKELRYMIPTVGDPLKMRNFDQAVDSVTKRIPKSDLVAVDALMAIEQAVGEAERNGGQVPERALGWWGRFRQWLESSFVFTLKQKDPDPLVVMAEAVDRVRTKSPEARDLQSALYERVAALCAEKGVKIAKRQTQIEPEALQPAAAAA